MARPTRIEWHGHEIAKVAPAAAEGLGEWADMVLEVSQTQVPVLSGELQSTGKATVDEPDLTAAVSYNHAYARKQHERMDFHHENGKAKYLEDPLNETQHEGLKILQRAILRVTR